MSFPTNPYTSQLAIEDNKLWCWNGEVWNLIQEDLVSYNPYGDVDEPIDEEPCNPDETVEDILRRIEQRLAAIETKLTDGFLLID